MEGTQLNELELETDEKECDSLSQSSFQDKFQHKRLSSNQHFFLREENKNAKCMNLKFGTLENPEKVTKVQFFKDCQKETDMKKYVKQEYDCRDGKAGEIVDKDSRCSLSETDCDKLMDDSLATFVILSEMKITFNFEKDKTKDVHGALVHFDPTATVPKKVNITDCGSRDKEFLLQDRSNHLLEFKSDFWTTSCLEVILGPEKYVHNASNDNIIVHLLYFTKYPCDD